MSEVRIEHLTDSHQCETCGSSYAEGAKIWVDGHLVKELVPIAHCFGGDNYTEEDILAETLNHFGHQLKRDN